MSNFGLSEIQSKAILDMRLQRLTGLEIDKIREEYAEVMKEIMHYENILGDEVLQMQIIKDELVEVRDKFGNERRTRIEFNADEINIEDLIPNEEVVVTIAIWGI